MDLAIGFGLMMEMVSVSGSGTEMVAGSGSGTEMVAGSGSGSVAGVGSSSGSVVGTGSGSCSMVGAGFIAGSLVGEGVYKVAEAEGKTMQEHPLHIASKRPSRTFSGQVCLGLLIDAGFKKKKHRERCGSCVWHSRSKKSLVWSSSSTSRR